MDESTINANAERSVWIATQLALEGVSDKTLYALADHLETMWEAGYNPLAMVRAIRFLLSNGEA